MMKRQPHHSDEYGFLDDIAQLEDAHEPAASGRSTQELLAGLADFEPADGHTAVATFPQSRSSDDLLNGLADLEDVRPVPRKKRKSRRSSGLRTAFSKLEDADDEEAEPPPPAARQTSVAVAEPPRPAAVPTPAAPRIEPVVERRPAPPAPLVEAPRATVVSPPTAPPQSLVVVSAPRPSYSPPPKRHSGGSSFDFSSLAGFAKPVGITAAILVVGYLGYLGFSRLGFAGSINASAVYAEVIQLNKDFEAVSAKGPDSPEFAAFYDHYGKRHAELFGMMGNPGSDTTAYKVKAAVGHLYSTVAAFKMKSGKSEQQAAHEELQRTLDQIKQEIGK